MGKMCRQKWVLQSLALSSCLLLVSDHSTGALYFGTKIVVTMSSLSGVQNLKKKSNHQQASVVFKNLRNVNIDSINPKKNPNITSKQWL